MKRRAVLAAVGVFWTAAASASSILPPGTQQFTDQNGTPLAGGTACFYVVGTTTPKQTWSDRAQSVPNTSPCVTLDSAGRAVIWGYGQYREEVYDQFGTLQWDKVTSDYVSDVQNGVFLYGGQSTTASLNAYQIVVSPTPPSYAAGQQFSWISNGTNTGTATLNVSGLGPEPLYKVSSGGPVPLAGGEIAEGNLVLTEYNGSLFQIIGQVPGVPAGAIACNDASGIGFWDNCNQTWTKAQRGGQAASAITPTAGTITLDMNSGQHFVVALDSTCPCTMANPTNLTAGQVGLIALEQDATGSRTTSWGTDFIWPSGTAPTLSTTPSVVDVFPYYVVNSTNLLMGTGGQDYTLH